MTRRHVLYVFYHAVIATAYLLYVFYHLSLFTVVQIDGIHDIGYLVNSSMEVVALVALVLCRYAAVHKLSITSFFLSNRQVLCSSSFFLCCCLHWLRLACALFVAG